MKHQGTPKTLAEAIENGFSEFFTQNYPTLSLRSESVLPGLIKAHVKDFLAQKFTTARLAAHFGRFNTDAHVMELFELCTSDSPREETYAEDQD